MRRLLKITYLLAWAYAALALILALTYNCTYQTIHKDLTIAALVGACLAGAAWLHYEKEG